MNDRAEEIARGWKAMASDEVVAALRASEERAEKMRDDIITLKQAVGKAEGRAAEWEAHAGEAERLWRGERAAREAAEARVKELVEALREAIDAIEGWAGYASDYFRDKHDLASDLSRASAALGAPNDP